ncbi:hypothetical protein QNI19_38460 [Cytophagaceae bacterium DM2B3-1]|uniref:Uncharacterized protein n=1 Tax=Xanthocytophaga flava TaxID=3048013 RepID=A0ABT7CYM1_9BACT|nr:hypothetical protein [Xanthocytophaga flavus]MDJ1498874.1 hypothetical protein [Xanthocytophaga flavus]
MKSVLFYCFFLFISFTCFSQNDTSAISLVSYWSKGDSFNFKITKVQQQWKKGELSKNDSSSYIANFLVLDSTASSYKIKWSYKNDLVSEYNIPSKFASLLSKYQVTEVIYTTTEMGQFVGIENWKEIGKMMKDLVADITETLYKDKPKEKEAFKKAMQAIESAYSSKEGVEQFIFKEIQYFHFPFGYQFSQTTPLTYEQPIPNMFGGSTVRGDTKLYIKGVDKKNSTFTLMQEMKLNPEDTRKMLTELFRKMNVPSTDKMMESAKIDINDTNQYEYDYLVGTPIKIETLRKTIVDIDKEKALRIDKIKIEVLKD